MAMITIFEPDEVGNPSLIKQAWQRERFNADIESLVRKYPDTVVKRFRPGDPSSDRVGETVRQLVREMGRVILPIIVIDGEIAASGEYPVLAELEASLMLFRKEADRTLLPKQAGTGPDN